MFGIYSSNTFMRLNEFYVAKSLSEQHRSDINLLGDVICEYGLDESFGISLLHKHFSISDNEALVETRTDDEIRVSTMTYSSNLTPYLWKFENSEGIWYPLEFSSSDAVMRFNQKLDSQFLKAFGMRLKELGLADVFGLSTLHRLDFITDENEAVLESTNHKLRQLILRPVSVEILEKEHTTETNWFFTVDKAHVSTGCKLHCKSHCRFHCPNHSRG